MAERIRFLSPIIIRLSAIETIRSSVKIYIAFRASPKWFSVSVVNFLNGISALGTEVNALVIMSFPSLFLNSWRYRSLSQNIALCLPLVLFIITASKASRTYIPSIRALFGISRVYKAFLAFEAEVKIDRVTYFSTCWIDTFVIIVTIKAWCAFCEHHMPTCPAF